MAEGNKSLPYGIIRTVRACFRRLGLYEFLEGLKEKGVPLSYVVELMCVYQLNGGGSMNECGALSGSVLVREELCHGHSISRKTIERGLFLLDLYFEETIVHLWRRLNEIYPDLSTDACVDGSHIPREGSGRGAYTAAGEGGGSVQLQDQFMIAQLCVSMVRYDMEPDQVVKRIDGRVVRMDHKPSTATICKNLSHWTVVLIPRDGFRVDRIYTDENDLTRRISEVLDRYRGCFRSLPRATGPWEAV